MYHCVLILIKTLNIFHQSASYSEAYTLNEYNIFNSLFSLSYNTEPIARPIDQ